MQTVIFRLFPASISDRKHTGIGIMSPDLPQIHAPHQVPDRASTVVLVDQSLDVNGM